VIEAMDVGPCPTSLPLLLSLAGLYSAFLVRSASVSYALRYPACDVRVCC